MSRAFHQAGGCLFCRIIRREIPSEIICETETVLAFLDIMPIREGHVQIVPKAHHETFDDLPEALAAEIIGVGQRIAKTLKRLHSIDRVALLFTGGDVPHAHAHVVPMAEATDITSRRYIAEEIVTFRDLPRAGREELRATGTLLRAMLAEGD